MKIVHLHLVLGAVSKPCAVITSCFLIHWRKAAAEQISSAPPPPLFSLLPLFFLLFPFWSQKLMSDKTFFFFFFLEAYSGPSLYSVFNCISQYLVQEIPGTWLVLLIKIQNTWISICVLLLCHLKFSSITTGKRPDAFCKSTLGYYLEECFLFWQYHHPYSYTILFLFGLML